MNDIELVLDIDNTMVCRVSCHQMREDWFKCFEKKKLVLQHNIDSEIHTYVINPGLKEFLLWVDMQPNIHLSIFSAGSITRNVPLIEALLIWAYGVEGAIEKYPDTKILSKEDIGEIDKEYDAWGNVVALVYYKDLKKIVPESTLARTVWIDDDRLRIFPGQEKNLLEIPKFDTQDIEQIYSAYINIVDYSSTLTFKKVNGLLYAIGILVNSIKMSERDNISLIEALYLTQGEPDFKKRKGACVAMNTGMHKYFYDGLDVVRSINPKFKFIGPDYFPGCKPLALIFQGPARLTDIMMVSDCRYFNVVDFKCLNNI